MDRMKDLLSFFIAAMAMFPAPIVHIIFGSGFRQAEPLLSLYAATTGLYALSVVFPNIFGGA